MRARKLGSQYQQTPEEQEEEKQCTKTKKKIVQNEFLLRQQRSRCESNVEQNSLTKAKCNTNWIRPSDWDSTLTRCSTECKRQMQCYAISRCCGCWSVKWGTAWSAYGTVRYGSAHHWAIEVRMSNALTRLRPGVQPELTPTPTPTASMANNGQEWPRMPNAKCFRVRAAPHRPSLTTGRWP